MKDWIILMILNAGCCIWNYLGYAETQDIYFLVLFLVSVSCTIFCIYKIIKNIWEKKK